MNNSTWQVFRGSRGGNTRMRIIERLRQQNLNAYQLKVAINLDYSTIRHSLRVLKKNHILTTTGEGYGTTYQLTPEFEHNIHEYDARIIQGYTEKKCEDTKIKNVPTHIEREVYILDASSLANTEIHF